MKDGRCSACGSDQVYHSRNGLHSPVLLDIGEQFELVCYVCAACRHVAFYASERSVALFGAGQPLRDMLHASRRWQPVQAED
jgi:hypothetical protein